MAAGMRFARSEAFVTRPVIHSKLPQVDTTIFSVITQRATELGAINLAQGFPDYDPPQRLKALLAESVEQGKNQYAPMPGVPALKEQIAAQFARTYGVTPDPAAEITITLGATEGIFSAIAALVHPGDEVIVFDPSYDSYGPAVSLAGGRTIHLALVPPRFSIDWAQVRAAIGPRTRAIIVNSPHNPTGAVCDAGDWEQLGDLVEGTDILVLADEVYEFMVFDGRKPFSLCAHSRLKERTVGFFSFGKTMHATGWRVGYAIAPAELTRELRRVHQFNTFTIATPLQHAIAAFLAGHPGHSPGLAEFYQRKRDRFLELLAGSRFNWTASPGTYFQLLDYSVISQQSDTDFADELMTKAGVASIPVSPFYEQPPDLKVLRFCFAKTDATLERAAERLRRL
jgi:methionine aminotransferase